MFNRKLIAAAVALAFAGAAQAQDAELAKIREEIRQMKESYEQRIETLEKRLVEAEATAGKAAESAAKAAAMPAQPVQSRAGDGERVQSRGIADPAGHVRRTRRRIRIPSRSPASCRRAGKSDRPSAASAWVKPSSTSPRISIPYFRGVAIVALTPGERGRGRGSVFPDARAAAGIHARRAAASSPASATRTRSTSTRGISRTRRCRTRRFSAAAAGRTALQLQLGRADADLPRARRRARRAATSFPASDRNKNGVGRQRGVRPPRRRHRRRATRGARDFPTCARPRGTARYEDVDSLGGAVTNSFTGKARLWIADAVLKWAPNGNRDAHQLQAAGRVFPRASRTARSPTTTPGRPRRSSARPSATTSRADQSGWYAQARVAVHAALARGLPLRPAALRDGRQRHRRERPGADRRRFSAARRTTVRRATPLMVDFSPSEFSRFRLQLARDKSRLGAHRQPGLPAVHPQPGPARRAQVLTSVNDMEKNMNRMLLFVAVIAAGLVRRRRPSPRSTSSPASRSGARSRRSWRATRPASTSATTALQDPHRIEARPSLIARARSRRPRRVHRRRAGGRLAAARADAVGQPEDTGGTAGLFRSGALRDHAGGAAAARSRAGRRARRPAIRTCISTRATSRRVAAALAERMAQLDPGEAAQYRARAQAFLQRWQEATARWEKAGAPLKGMADRRLPQEHDLPQQLARHARGRLARAQAGPAADRVALERARSRRSRASRRRRSCAPPTTIRARRNGCPSARRFPPSPCPSRSAATRRRRTCSGSSTTPWRACWLQPNEPRGHRSGHPGTRIRRGPAGHGHARAARHTGA